MNSDDRASQLQSDLQQDRRKILKKIQQRQKSQRLLSNKDGEGGDTNDANAAAFDNDDFSSDIPDIDSNPSYDMQLLRDVRAAHEEDEQYIRGGKGSRIGGGGGGGGMSGGPGAGDIDEEGLEAMNQALTSPPTQWWAMRKQWQKRRGNVINMMGLGGASSHGDEFMDVDGSYREGGQQGEGLDVSARSGRSALSATLRHPGGMATTTDAGVVGHPVMLDDPYTIGYDAGSFRQNPFAKKGKKKKAPSVKYVSKEYLKKRKIQQSMYIIAALCVVFLFMFLLQQRKLSHYAMVQSPITLSAYLAGEQLMDERNGEKVTLGDLGLKEFQHEVGAIPEVEFGKLEPLPETQPEPQTEFQPEFQSEFQPNDEFPELGNIELAPDDPLANEELANDPFVGNVHMKASPLPLDDLAQMRGEDRFALLRGVVVGWGITPADVFENKHSPQYHALSWMANEDVMRYTPENDHWIKKIIQRYSLVTLYYATDGPGWTQTYLFLSNYDECDWNKVIDGFFRGAGVCEGGFITALALWSNNLKGGLPAEVGSFDRLRLFSIFDNKIDLPPPKTMANLKKLQVFLLNKNTFKDADLKYLCDVEHKYSVFKSDCGRRGGVNCPCCNGCGFSFKLDRDRMKKENFNWIQDQTT